MTPTAAPPGPSTPAPILSRHPGIGILAVLLGAFIATLTGRLSTFGLADIRGAVHAGLDEGAWITTAQTVAQMLIGPIAVWLGQVFGARRVLLAGCAVFGLSQVMAPLSTDLTMLLISQFLSGLGSGCFIPLTIGFVLQNLSMRWWPFGIAVYALNLETSLNISASIEGWWVEHASWQWIFWQNLPLAIGMAVSIWWGVPRQPINRAALRQADLFGMLSFGVGLALLYAALDQGNRLDWFNSGLVVALLAGSATLLAAFVLHERVSPNPWIGFRVALSGNLPVLLALIGAVRLAVLSTAYLIPQFLVSVRGYRALDIGPVLGWIAAPQLLCAALAGYFLRRVDARFITAVGLGLVGGACFAVAHGLTADWGSDDFIASQLVQAVGQCFAVSSIIFFGVLNMRPAEALTFGVLLQSARLLGGEVGLAGITTWVRKAEQGASQLIGYHVSNGAQNVSDRLALYRGGIIPRSDTVDATNQASVLLGAAVRTQSNVYSYIDGFMAVSLCMGVAILVLALLRPVHAHPAGPISWRLLRGPGR